MTSKVESSKNPCLVVNLLIDLMIIKMFELGIYLFLKCDCKQLMTMILKSGLGYLECNRWAI